MSNRSAEMHMRASRHFFDKYEELEMSRLDKNTKYIYRLNQKVRKYKKIQKIY